MQVIMLCLNRNPTNMRIKANSSIPIVSFSAFLKGNLEERTKVANEVFQAFENVGFVYLKDYPELTTKVKDIFKLAKEFFGQPESDKMKVVRGKDPNDVLGYVAFGTEGLSNSDIDSKGDAQDKSELVFDMKESYQIYNENMVPPYPDIPGFREKIDEFFEECHIANLNIMSCIAIGLQLEPHFFDKSNDEKANTLRLLHYPSMPNKPNIKRAGAHTDYGSITLLFQDSCGGLQVKNTSGEFVNAEPIPDTIVVNVADMLQRWSNDRLKSTLHRVVAPAAVSEFSIAYFCTPNMNLTIECLPSCEGKEGVKYEPINSGEYLLRRVRGHY